MKKLTSVILMLLVAGAGSKFLRDHVQKQRNRKAVERMFDRRPWAQPPRVSEPSPGGRATGAQGRWRAAEGQR